MDVGVTRCWNGSPVLVSAALVDPQRGGQTTLSASQVAVGSKRLRIVELGTPYKRPMSSSGRLSVDVPPSSPKGSCVIIKNPKETRMNAGEVAGNNPFEIKKSLRPLYRSAYPVHILYARHCWENLYMIKSEMRRAVEEVELLHSSVRREPEMAMGGAHSLETLWTLGSQRNWNGDSAEYV
ncbi:jg4778 [Pararge aegeria aegeria]|uniref:Jg4778 protein n=1 Tax=Pararge aegeria aegeria TaxID=348720 RepID=A0A8S4R5M0_9NEOP|nr:jg4778 [Pararge aegeria aegeria]